MQEKRLSIKHVELEDNEEEKHIKNRNKNSSKENRMKRNRKSIEILGIEETTIRKKNSKWVFLLKGAFHIRIRKIEEQKYKAIYIILYLYIYFIYQILLQFICLIILSIMY